MLWSPRMVLRTLLGGWGLGPRYNLINLKAEQPLLDAILPVYEQGKLTIPIDSTFSFTDQGVKDAFAKLDSARAKGKIVVKVAD